MTFSMTTDNGKAIAFSNSLPADLSRHKVFPSVYTAIEKWGTVIIQAVHEDEFYLWFSQFFIKEDVTLLVDVKIPAIELYTSLKNSFMFLPDGQDEISLKPGYFNMTNFPMTKRIIHLKKGEYSSFNISFSDFCLIKYLPLIPSISPFLRSADQKRYCHLVNKPLHITRGMKQTITEILTHKYTNKLHHIYLETAVLQLLTLAMEKVSELEKPVSSLTAKEIDNIEKAKEWLDNHPEETIPTNKLANNFHLGEYKLKSGFKELYGVTVFEYQTILKLEHAKKLIIETDIKIADIAYMTGYSTNSHFTKAFKNHFGYPPNDLRDKKK